VGEADPGDDADLDLAGSGSKGDLALDDLGGDEGVKGAGADGVDGLSSSAAGGDAGDDLKGGFDLDDAEADLADSGTGAKGALVLDDPDDGLDDLGPDVKVLGGGIDDLDGIDALKGDDVDDLDLDTDGGGAFGADLGEVPDLGAKGDFADDDTSLFEQKGSIIDAVAEELKGGLDDDPDDVDF
jgi:hypothetical protein